MADLPTPESTPWGWKALIISCIVGAIFLGFIYLAVNNEADYMPSQQKKHMQHHEETQKNAANPQNMTAEEHGMTEEEHAHMNMAQDDASSTPHNH